MLALALALAAAPVAPADARGDLRHLYDRLAAAEYDLFAHSPRARMDRAFADAEALLDRPLDELEVAALYQRFVATARIAHARIDFLGAAFADHRAKGGASFPIDVRIDDGRMFVTANRSAVARIRPGDEIVTIDGRPARRWSERYRHWVSADTDRLADTIVEYRLPALLWLDRGSRRPFDLRVRQRTGGEFRTRVAPLDATAQAANAQGRPKPFALDQGRSAKMLTPGIAYLRPGPFYNSEGEAWDNRGFVAFIDRAFADFEGAGATSLIIDLRDNPGGDSSFSDPMIAWIADRPWRFAARFTIRASPEAEASNAERLATAQKARFADPVSPVFARLLEGARPGALVDFPLTESRPRSSGRFAGEAYALIDRYCFSNCANVAAILQDYRFATILGEPTADLVTTQGAMEHFTLPRTGIRVGFAKARIVRPNGDEREAGVTPDVAIANPAAPARDAMLDAALDYVRRAAAQNAPSCSSSESGRNGSSPEPGNKANSPNHSRPPTS
jgi:hypothetical protein